ncbi:DUF445 family protein [Moorellaceae bacterium AZ2]
MLSWIVIPLLGAFIGWITNVLAIRLLFRPRRPYKFFFWILQGLIPKRRSEIASSVAAVVDKDLLPPEELLNRLKTSDMGQRVVTVIVELVRQRIEERFPSFLPPAWKQALSHTLEEVIRREVPVFLKRLEEEFWLTSCQYSLGAIVAEKLNGLDLEKVEELVVKVAARELRYIELLGGLLGLVIGVIQVVVIRLFS